MHSSPDSFIVNLTTHTYGGETLGRLPDGRAVFVPFAMPGEEVRVRLIEEKRGYARAELIEVVTASPVRITPVCKHFTTCGGCHYQHMPYASQLSAKNNILRDQLVRLGKIKDPPVKPTVSSPRQYHYRNNIQFQVTEQGSLGFYGTQTDDILAIQECHLPEEALNLLWPKLDFEPGAELKRVSLRLGKDEDILITLESNDPEPPEFMVEDLPISAIYLGPDVVHVLAGNSYIVIEVLERPFRVSAASFFQVNTPMAAVMVAHVLDYLDLKSTDTVIDAYAGVGLFSAFMAPRIKRLLAIEDVPQACADFVYNLDEFDNVELYQGKVEDILPVLEVKPQAILVDPSRAGLDRHVVDGILDMQPEVLVYVSCDPATLARDARRLTTGGYRLENITPFDLFPQTYHIESISFWHRL
jgi:23S rRNA (uracil1939-C5)-methyltransferase